jgi:hypothetical protein
MSDVMTSRSMPSRGTKYSFWRAAAGGIGCVWLDRLLGLPAIVGSGGKEKTVKSRRQERLREEESGDQRPGTEIGIEN